MAKCKSNGYEIQIQDSGLHFIYFCYYNHIIATKQTCTHIHLHTKIGFIHDSKFCVWFTPMAHWPRCEVDMSVGRRTRRHESLPVTHVVDDDNASLPYNTSQKYSSKNLDISNTYDSLRQTIGVGIQ